MKNLSKEQVKLKADLVLSLSTEMDELKTAVVAYNEKKAEAFAALDKAVADFNSAMSEAWGEVGAAVESYNEEVTKARDFASEIAGDIESYYDDKSDKWKESERGESYSSWKDEWQGISLDDLELEQPSEIEIEEPEDLDEPDADHSTELENLPEEPQA